MIKALFLEDVGIEKKHCHYSGDRNMRYRILKEVPRIIRLHFPAKKLFDGFQFQNKYVYCTEYGKYFILHKTHQGLSCDNVTFFSKTL